MPDNTIKKSKFLLFSSKNEKVFVDVYFRNENIWLSQKLMAQLFGVGIPAINKHLKNIFESGELEERQGISILEIPYELGHTEGLQQQKVQFYNLDAIISVGYRVNSTQATKFRQWATARLHEYIIKGFTMDDERLKGTGGGNYWKELLDRIRDIRSSEKALYRQVLDLYATSIDYNPKSSDSLLFFKTVQNKLHYATHKHTAAETIAKRADAQKDFMGLTTFAGVSPTLSEVTVAKNYLTEDELFRLNRMVSAFFDLAEIKAQEQKEMRMADWVAELDTFAKNYGKGVLQNAGKISHKEASKKAMKEYKKFQAKTLSPVEEAYLENIKLLQKKVSKKTK